MVDTKYKDIVLVTGAASGIGLAVAKKYLLEGFTVIGLDINTASTPFPIIYCNLSQEQEVSAAFDDIHKMTSSIQYLINCAGIFYNQSRTPIDSLSVNEWNAVYKNNSTSVMLVTKYALPLLKKSCRDKAIINISSDQVKYPRTKNTPYAVSKASIETFSKACAIEFLDDHIRVNVVEAASVKTNFIDKLAGSPEKKSEIYQKEDQKMPYGLISPEDISEIVFFLGSCKASKITGQTILVDSGLYL